MAVTLTDRSNSSRSSASGSRSTLGWRAQIVVRRPHLTRFPGLHRRDRREPLSFDALPESAPQRRMGVRPKIETVPLEDSFQQQLNLDPLQLWIVRDGRPAELGGTRRIDQRYSHTRIRLSSWSVSTGLVM